MSTVSSNKAPLGGACAPEPTLSPSLQLRADVLRRCRQEDAAGSAQEAPATSALAEKYARYSRPGLSKLLHAIRMDIVYTRARGDYLYYQKNGEEVPVLDMLGGFGACLFGHLFEPFVALQKAYLDAGVPFLAQGSCRSQAALVGERLDRMLHARTGAHYVSVLLNTGADAVEAALKHAEMRRMHRFQALREAFEEQLVKVRQGLLNQTLTLDETFRAAAESQFGVPRDLGNEATLAALSWAMGQASSRSPTALAVKGGYHGKTTGALQVTSGEAYRKPFAGLGAQGRFIDASVPGALLAAIDDSLVYLPAISLSKGEVRLTRQAVANLNALFVEPLQGEGGIRSVPLAFLEESRRLATQHGFQLVFDEIQCGMGRTGTFLYSEQLGVTADCYLLSKSLGGGMSKVSAVCFARHLYQPDFDAIHSSTFAEDDYSAAIALRALTLLDEVPAIMAAAAQQGEYLRQGLQDVCAHYPGILKEVRGQGLLLGIEFQPQSDANSLFIRTLSEQKLLGYVIAGYLLHEHRVRISTTLSNAFTLRLEPSAFVTQQACDQVVAGIRRVAEILHKLNAGQLLRYVVGREQCGDDSPVACYRQRNAPAGRFEPGHKTVTFIGTPLSARDFADADPSLADFSDAELGGLLARFRPVAAPVHLQTHTITSATGDKVNFRFVALLHEPLHITEQLATGSLDEMVGLIRDTLHEAEESRHVAYGLGAYTSIVTGNGLRLVSDKLSITTGNALTVGMGVQGLLQTAQEKGLDLKTSTFAVVGAAGNIGSVYTEILADHVPRVILVGRRQSEARLIKVAIEVYLNAYRDLLAGQYPETSVAAVLATSQSFARLRQGEGLDDPGPFLYRELQQELGEAAPVIVSTDLYSLKQANLILTTSNAAEPIIFPDMLGSQPSVICDVSVPNDVDASVTRQCPQVQVVRGGLVRLPGNPDLRWSGKNHMGNGVTYACMAETMLLGLSETAAHYSYGRISKMQVRKILALAATHGFDLARIKVDSIF
ncbi:MAG: aminotransferase class III-fold pyridoxal phosphate-dependent enzyme [Pseudomonas sp.]|uniref:aminotransferase class III-fold pyridoxal phosphate-dependent enzyme n=1 Tax=Pseudomonas sp. TaxID=306 RepID=UPI0033965549